MARLFEDSDCDQAAEISDADLRAQLELPPLLLEEWFDTPAVRERIGSMISHAVRRNVRVGF
jgi:hypothetical protein